MPQNQHADGEEPENLPRGDRVDPTATGKHSSEGNRQVHSR